MGPPRPKYPLARLSPAKEGLVAFAIDRASVMDCDIAPMLVNLDALTQDRDTAIRYEGLVTFFFTGWDDDPRETADIPEIRAYFEALTEAWPYWLHYIEKVGDTFGHVLRLLCAGHYIQVQPGLVAWDFDDLLEVQACLGRLFTGMNALHDTLGLPEAMNERISQEVAQMIENALE